MQQDLDVFYDCTRDGQKLSIPNAVIDLFGGDLAVRKRITGTSRKHGYNVTTQGESLLRGELDFHDDIELGHAPIANAGMIEVLEYLAAEQDRKLRFRSVVTISTLPIPQLDPGMQWSALPLFVRDVPWGLISVSSSLADEVIVDLVKAYPEQRIVVLGSVPALNRFDTKFGELIKKLCPNHARDYVKVDSDNHHHVRDDEEMPRLLMSTPLASAAYEIEKCDLVILLDAHHCMNTNMQWPLMQVDARFRLFGLVDPTRIPKPFEQARLHRMFGFRRLDLMDRGRVRRPTYFAWVRQSGSISPKAIIEHPTLPGRRPRKTVDAMPAYVFNHSRNATICDLAEKLQQGAPLRSDRWRDVHRWRRDYGDGPLGVTILVDRLDHAAQLGRRLRDWPIVADRWSNLHGLPGNIRRRVRKGLENDATSNCQIVVVDQAHRLNDFTTDVVIWAAGGTSANVPDAWSYSATEPDRPMLIVDLLDAFDSTTESWSYWRRSGLEAQDVFRVGTSPHIGRIERFLRNLGATE